MVFVVRIENEWLFSDLRKRMNMSIRKEKREGRLMTDKTSKLIILIRRAIYLLIQRFILTLSVCVVCLRWFIIPGNLPMKNLPTTQYALRECQLVSFPLYFKSQIRKSFFLSFFISPFELWPLANAMLINNLNYERIRSRVAFLSRVCSWVMLLNMGIQRL